MKTQIEAWIQIVRPWVEEEFGPLPPFSIKAAGWPLIDDVPWRIDPDYRTNKATLLYYPKWFQKQGFTSNENPLQQNGYVISALVHDLLHLYQQESEANELGIRRCLPKFVNLFSYMIRRSEWNEGSAELGSWKILYQRLEQKTLVVPSQPRNVFLALLNEEYQWSLALFLAKHLSRCLYALRDAGLIPSISPTAIGFPFSIPRIVCDLMVMYNYGEALKPNCYQRGMFRCAQLVSRGDISLRQLLRTPYTNKKLKAAAGI